MMKSPEEMKEQVARVVDGAETVVVFAVTPEGKPRMVMHGDPATIVHLLSNLAPRAVALVVKQISEPGVNMEEGEGDEKVP